MSLCPELCYGQNPEPQNCRYKVKIDFGKAYISGICIKKDVEGGSLWSLMNEFGVSALSFSYDESRQKTRIISMLKILRKPGVKAVLRRDLSVICEDLEHTEGLDTLTHSYVSAYKEDIVYNFTPLRNEITQ